MCWQQCRSCLLAVAICPCFCPGAFNMYCSWTCSLNEKSGTCASGHYTQPEIHHMMMPMLVFKWVECMNRVCKEPCQTEFNESA